MTPQNFLRWIGGGADVRLIGGSTGIELAHEGYAPAVAEQNPDGTWPREVLEAMGIYIEGDDSDEIATRLRNLKNILRRGAEYTRNQVNSSPVWWHQRLDGESEERRAIMRHGRTQYGTNIFSTPTTIANFVDVYTLGIARAPFWEYTSPISRTPATLSCGGAIESYADGITKIPGDAGARIDIATINSDSGGPIAECWMGIRTELFGNRGNFQPVWQCEDGAPGTDTSDTGTEMTCTFATTATMAERMTITLNQATGGANNRDQKGQHLVLLRVQATGTLNARLFMKSGYAATSEWKEFDFVTVDSTSYLFYPLGSIQIPVKSYQETRSFDKWEDDEFFSLAIEAERVSGSGNLVMDRLVLIPQGESWCHVSDTNIPAGSSATDDATYILTTPLDDFLVRPGNNQVVARSPRLEVDKALGFYLPPGMGEIVFAGQRATSQVTTDTCDVFFSFYPRHTELRGDVT